MLKAYLPEFSGFASPGWAALISGQRRRAAENPELIKINDYVLDADDFHEIFEETADEGRQRMETARSFFEIFRMSLMVTRGIGDDLEFVRYDTKTDRIVALISLNAAAAIVELGARTGPRVFDGSLPDDFATLYYLVQASEERNVEGVIRRLRTSDPSTLGGLLQTVCMPGLETWAMTAIGHQCADDALEHAVDWRRFWTLVEMRYRKKGGPISQWYQP